ncbi:hypothetical protein [Weissella confusa]|uniref:hypothetical protein n=1 Tax=Weissella confusa TaxID=1583 RepID=UPI001782EA75|nr:hypothetical protein [Weissella confusa]MBD5833243.1 hypothetical protein [Weissella confusa]
MAKTKFVSPQQYASNLGAVIQATEDAGNKVAPFFEKLDDAIKADKVAEMPKAEFQEIAMEFDEAVAVYKDASAKINAIAAPVRLMGVHQSMKKTVGEYADATEMMAKSLDVENQTINMDDFKQSETDQDTLMEKFLVQVRRIMNTVM